MTKRATFPAQAIGLSLVLATPAAAAPASAPAAPVAPDAAGRKPAVRVYTNDDLERVHPFIAETGVTSTPAVPPDSVEQAAAEPGAGRAAAREAHWRAEAARVRARVRALEERAAALRLRIAERAREPEIFGRRRSASARGASIASLKASLAALEGRIRTTQDDLEERARREGALPGWLR